MDEKKVLYQIILTIWELMKKYCFIKLDDDGWQAMSDEANILSNDFKQYNENVRRLFVDIYFAFENYKAARDREGQHENSI